MLGYNQTATYWASSGRDRDGVDTFASPVAIPCHWEERNEEVTNNNGQTFVSQAVVYLDSNVGVGGYLALGNHTSTADPRGFAAAAIGAQEIKKVSSIPDIRNVRTERRAYL